MGPAGLATVLVLLAAVILVVAAMRRLHLPPILGYLVAGMVLGPHALGLVADSPATAFLAELGVVFLLFTLGLEFSLPRLLARRREVVGLGSLQVAATTLAAGGIAWASGFPALVAIVIGGAVAMSSTAIIVQQLTDQAEINRTHGRLAFSVLLYQDLVFVLFLSLATALPDGGGYRIGDLVWALVKAFVALLFVLAAGRYLARPLFFEIARSRSRELFTLAVLFVALGSAFATHAVGLSLALGSFLAGLLLAETEYRHQVDAVIRPFRDVLLGLFFVTIGMSLDLPLLGAEFGFMLLLVVAMLAGKSLIAALAARPFSADAFKALRAGLVVAAGGEFGFALLTVLRQEHIAGSARLDTVLAAVVLSMVVSPLLIRHNKLVARLLLRQQGPDTTAIARETGIDTALARREHVLLCGYGRVGQNIARVLERQGHEFLAMDLDPHRVRSARQAGDPVIYGDGADERVLLATGIAHASVVVVTFADPATSLAIVRAARRARADVPILVRTQDDSRLAELKAAGASEVVPETFEASLMLVAHVLYFLDTPMSRVVKTVSEIRSERYGALRGVIPREDGAPVAEDALAREELRSVVVPPGAWAVGRTLAEVRTRGAEVSFAALRRGGIVGREPAAGVLLREGDVLVVAGSAQAIEHAEAIVLAG